METLSEPQRRAVEKLVELMLSEQVTINIMDAHDFIAYECRDELTLDLKGTIYGLKTIAIHMDPFYQ